MIFPKRYFPALCPCLPHVAARNLQTKIQVKQNVQEIKNNVKFISKHLNISEIEAQDLSIRQPVIAKLNEERIKSLFDVLHEVGLSKEVIIRKPTIFGVLPITLKLRYNVLKECGIENVTSDLLTSYLKVVKHTTIGELKKTGVIPAHIDVENRLASYMTEWPTSLTTLIIEDVDKLTLYNLRLKILQRFLQVVFDLTNEEFYRGIDTYNIGIRHRPLECINETLVIFQSQIMIPNHKIKSNFYLIHANPENLKNILSNFQSIGGIDVREVIRMYPKIALRNCEILLEMRKVLQEYGISNEAQRKCLDIYNLSPKSVRERLEEAKNIPEFNIYRNHPRYLKLIYYKNTAMKRIKELYKKNKKCMSLNVLSESSARYQTFQGSSGDNLVKGNDLIFCIYQALGRKFKKSLIRETIQRHPFWMYTPLIQVKYVYEKLSEHYTDHDICENCPILLYPWQKIKDTLSMLQKEQSILLHENFKFNLLNNSQKLSLALYILERNHSFSGNGVWLVE